VVGELPEAAADKVPATGLRARKGRQVGRALDRAGRAARGVGGKGGNLEVSTDTGGGSPCGQDSTQSMSPQRQAVWKVTMPVGPTCTGNRKSSWSGCRLTGRRRPNSPASSSSPGMRPVARQARRPLTSSCHACNCICRSSMSRYRRVLKKAPFTKPTRFSTDPSWRGWYGQQTSTATSSRAFTSANVGFQASSAPVCGSYFVTIVRERSKTASNGSPQSGKNARPAGALA